MGATWVGGGFINGSAQGVYSKGLIWTQVGWPVLLASFNVIFLLRLLSDTASPSSLEELSLRARCERAAMLR